MYTVEITPISDFTFSTTVQLDRISECSAAASDMDAM